MNRRAILVGVTSFGLKSCSTKFAMPGLNSINVKRAHFSYERLFSSYILALKEFSYEKLARLTLMKLTAGLNSIKHLQLF